VSEFRCILSSNIFFMSTSVVKNCHRIMGAGSVDACNNRREGEGCDVCCNDGSMLVPGETLDSIPDGVVVEGWRVLNCSLNGVCRFDPDDKPLICKITPVVLPSRDGGLIILGKEEGDIDDSESVCPVIGCVSNTFRKKVRKVYNLLLESGVFVKVK
jgi:hypothetical protein